MPASIGVNLRVTGHCRQGGRKYMEDFFSVAYQQTEDEKDLEYAFFGIYDGHGGAEAAAFAKEHLMETIIKHKNFWSDCDEDVLRAIKDGYIATHYAMWKEQEKWPRTASGLPSTAGTTASVAFIRRGKIYIGHVGDSGIILGYQEPGSSEWKARPLTRDHKPENIEEMSRIEQCGGKVVAKSGVPRVVWNRPKIGHQGPVRRSTPIDEIPFLAVARSLGDLWSYNSQIDQFVVSPDPDCSVFKIDTNIHRCLIFGTDGLYNMLSPMMAVHIVQQAERHNEHAALSDSTYKTWLNPSKLLVERALERWHATKMRADNTSVVTLMLDPPGPPRAQVLKDRKKNLPERGLRIMTRFDGNTTQESNCNNDNTRLDESGENPAQTVMENVPEPTPAIPVVPEVVPNNNNNNHEENKSECTTSDSENTPVSSSDLTLNFPLKERNFLPKPRDSTSFDPREPLPRQSLVAENGKENNLKASQSSDDIIQCNEISSSNIEADSTCDEEGAVDSTSKCERQNLRSGKKVKSEIVSKARGRDNVENVKISKRTLDSEQSTSSPRKSMRLDYNQKKVAESEDKEKKPSVAEEKLKKLAENAFVAKKSGLPPKLSLAQKILKSKKINLKKKCLVKQPISKKKIQMVLNTVRRVQKSTSSVKAPPSKPKRKEAAVKVKTKMPAKKTEAQTKVVASKAGSLKRQAVQNSSQRQRNVVGKVNEKKLDVPVKVKTLKQNAVDVKVNAKKDSDKANDGANEIKASNKGRKEERTKSEAAVKSSANPKKNATVKNGSDVSSSGSKRGSSSRSLRSSVSHEAVQEPTSNTLPLKQEPSTKKMPKIKNPVKAKTLGKRIQMKTRILRKNVMRKK